MQGGTLALRDADGDGVDHHQVGEARRERCVDFEVFLDIDGDGDGGGFGNGGAAGSQCHHGAASLAHPCDRIDQNARAPRLRDGQYHIAFPQRGGGHALQQRVGVGGRGQLQAEELVLGVDGDRRRGAEAVNFDPPGGAQGIHCLIQLLRIDGVTHLQQGIDGAVEDFHGVLARRVGIGHRDLAVAGAGRQLLGQRQLERLKAVKAGGATEAHHGGLADLGVLGQVDDAHQDDFVGLLQYILCDLALRFAQLGQDGCDGLGDRGRLHSSLESCNFFTEYPRLPADGRQPALRRLGRPRETEGWFTMPAMDVSPIIDSLNSAQREAVTCDRRHLLVLAGAGSGKTRVLVHRIAWLMQVEGVSPWEIMAVTFTNKAARELRERIDVLRGGTPQGMWVGTFHGLAHRLLRAHWRDAELPEHFQILDSDDQLRLVKRVCQQLELDEARFPPKQAQWFINGQKDEGLRSHHIQPPTNSFERTMHDIYRAYEEACRRAGSVDFAELLLRAHELLRDKPELLAHYQQRFRHILVDEFQDTNAIQYAWIRLLAGSVVQVTAVGDDDQSIYGWRGARIENILNFERDFPDTHTVRLEQNYRSTGNILAAANAVIAHNSERMSKQLWTSSSEGEPIALYAAFNEQDEARFIAERIQEWVRDGGMRRDVGILYRSNAQSRVLEEALLRLGVPYRIYGGHRFYERMEIRNALAYLRLMVNRDDDAAFERVINTPPRGIGDKTLQPLRELARADNLTLWRASEKALAHNLFAARAANALRGFLDLIETLATDSADLDLPQRMERVVQRSGLLDYHGKEKGERGEARVENLQELVSAAGNFDVDLAEEGDPLVVFLDQAALDAGDHQAEADEDAVQMMTLHSAKGLEFPLVFLTGMEEGLFPHKMSAEEPGRLEEERRLCYVGITRAMEKLYLTHAESRRLFGGDNYNPLSRFVRDIPSHLLEEVRLQNQVSQPVAGAPRRPFANGLSDSGNDTGLSLGQHVNHRIFGEGVILNFEGNGAHARVQVNFVNEGSKWLVVAYANLEPV